MAEKTPAKWTVSLHDQFEPEFGGLPADVQDGLLAAAKAIQIAGPKAGRPHVDTLNGSKHANMKELRFKTENGNEEWRAAFAFDPRRNAVILVAGAKQGKNQQLFYKKLISVADRRFDQHLGSVMGRKERSR
ncbi:MAG TPA: type II toxin-antitoxin system RelE/ParE family toxin [Usitatibacter sp.]|nr:type II toxin-antitoxin system RelE/ParE family toxin [Usitatibacter sp.]